VLGVDMAGVSNLNESIAFAIYIEWMSLDNCQDHDMHMIELQCPTIELRGSEN